MVAWAETATKWLLQNYFDPKGYRHDTAAKSSKIMIDLIVKNEPGKIVYSDGGLAGCFVGIATEILTRYALGIGIGDSNVRLSTLHEDRRGIDILLSHSNASIGIGVKASKCGKPAHIRDKRLGMIPVVNLCPGQNGKDLLFDYLTNLRLSTLTPADFITNNSAGLARLNAIFAKDIQRSLESKRFLGDTHLQSYRIGLLEIAGKLR